MRFRDFYNHVSGLDGPFVRFEDLRRIVNAYHQGIGRVDVIFVQHPEPNRQAFYRLADNERSSPHDEEFSIAEIVCCDGLREHPRERRYACTKELMHVFDTLEQRADSREKFITLMREIQNKPMPQHESPMFRSELDTRWMAAISLCPKHLRDPFVAAYKAKQIADFDIAETFRIPEWVAPFVMDDYYDVAFEALISAE
ncbi:hypothetical protein [Novosphingobium sp. MD-1]|uniref:hypothetical protein n=1 Tax=Novosphingobium sp. MD-1 TaxID=1630648 RepID=UPI000F7F8959|nr:hypothetical protein [Novosphingobium sp. MD-1]